MRILVTGGAGYIGSHAVLALTDADHEVVVVDNLSCGHREVIEHLQRVSLVIGDIGDRTLMRRVFSENRIDAVMHFSAYAYVGESVRNPSKYYRNNVAAMIHLLDEVIEAGVRRFVFSSTCATYGSPQQMPIREDCPQNPINPYGASKLMAERILADYGHAYGLNSVIFRYFNAAGADPAGRSGEDHDPETHLIPLILDAVSGRRGNVSVYGNDYDTPDGTCIRDYIHVSDLARAHLLGVNLLMGGNPSDTFNLSTGRGYSVNEVIRAVERVTGRPVPVHTAARRAGDPAELVGDAGKAQARLGWVPEYPEIDTMVSHAFEWTKKQIDRS